MGVLRNILRPVLRTPLSALTSRYGGGIDYPALLNDGNTKAWFDMAEDYMTIPQSNQVSQWSDRSGNDNHLLQATEAYWPFWSADGLLFNGAQSGMQAVSFPLAQPIFIYAVLKQVTWTDADRIWDGNLSNRGSVYQGSGSPGLHPRAGGVGLVNYNLDVGEWGILRVLYNWESSSFQINETLKATGNYGPLAMDGFSLGQLSTTGQKSNIEVKEVIIRNVVDSDADSKIIHDYLKAKYSLTPLSDGNTVAWFDMAEHYMTLDSADRVSAWADRSGNGNHLLQAVEADQPTWSANGVLFDGVSQFLKTATFPLGQPQHIYIVFKQVTWVNGQKFFDGNSPSTGILYNSISSPYLRTSAGSDSLYDNKLAVNTWGIVRIVFNGANSKLQINEETAKTGNSGTGGVGMKGFTLGARADGAAQWANMEVKEVIIRNVVDGADKEQTFYDYLKDKYSL